MVTELFVRTIAGSSYIPYFITMKAGNFLTSEKLIYQYSFQSWNQIKFVISFPINTKCWFSEIISLLLRHFLEYNRNPSSQRLFTPQQIYVLCIFSCKEFADRISFYPNHPLFPVFPIFPPAHASPFQYDFLNSVTSHPLKMSQLSQSPFF